MDNLFDEQIDRQTGSVRLDFKRVLARAIRFWYVVVIFLIGSFVIAFYKTRYSERVYPISASVVIREMQETGGAEILYSNGLINPYRNYLNEPYIIRSFPLINKVVRNLDFQVAFYREGYLMTTEAYEYVPVKAECLGSGDGRTARLLFTLLNERQYKLEKYPSEKKTDSRVFSLGDSIEFGDHKLCIREVPFRKLKSYVGVPFLLVIQNPNVITGSYVARLKVDWAEEGAGIINLSLTGTNPEKEIDFMNELIREYRQLDLDKKNETADRTIAFIRSQLGNIKDSLRTVEYQLERFGNNSRIKDLSDQSERLLTKLEALEGQKTELLIREGYYKYVTEYLRIGKTSLDQIILPSSVGLNDPILTSLLTRMMDTQLEIKLFTDPDRGQNPLVAAKMQRIEELKREVGEAVRTLRSTDNIKMDFLTKQIKSYEEQMMKLPASERQLISVQRNYSLLENLYVFLMQKLSEAGISKAANTSDIIPVNAPMRGGAILPKPSQNYTVAAILGLAIPTLIFILFELINNKVQSKEDIEKMTTIPFVGGVGHNETGGNLTVRSRPKSGVSESFRAMRSNLNYFTGNKSKQVFMVSSSISGEGKTFTTINLATVFALSGKKTLIVGADMRRPKIFEDFSRSNNAGLSTFLSGMSTFDEVVQDTEIDNLYLVSGGPVPPNPSELLLTEGFEKFIKQARERFEFIIIDTPPLALVTDAFVISHFVNHTVFVLRQNYSPKEFVRSIDEYYRSGKIKNISILLNDIYKSGLGYGYGQGYAYHYGYSYGYGYGRRKSKRGNGYYED